MEEVEFYYKKKYIIFLIFFILAMSSFASSTKELVFFIDKEDNTNDSIQKLNFFNNIDFEFVDLPLKDKIIAPSLSKLNILSGFLDINDNQSINSNYFYSKYDFYIDTEEIFNITKIYGYNGIINNLNIYNSMKNFEVDNSLKYSWKNNSKLFFIKVPIFLKYIKSNNFLSGRSDFLLNLFSQFEFNLGAGYDGNAIFNTGFQYNNDIFRFESKLFLISDFSNSINLIPYLLASVKYKSFFKATLFLDSQLNNGNYENSYFGSDLVFNYDVIYLYNRFIFLFNEFLGVRSIPTSMDFNDLVGVCIYLKYFTLKTEVFFDLYRLTLLSIIGGNIKLLDINIRFFELSFVSEVTYDLNNSSFNLKNEFGHKFNINKKSNIFINLLPIARFNKDYEVMFEFKLNFGTEFYL